MVKKVEKLSKKAKKLIDTGKSMMIIRGKGGWGRWKRLWGDRW